MANTESLNDIIANHYQPQKVIIAADNDNEGDIHGKLLKLKGSLLKSGIEVEIKVPNPQSKEKCDWNDILKEEGLSKLIDIFS